MHNIVVNFNLIFDIFFISLPTPIIDCLFSFRRKRKQRVFKKASIIFHFSRNLFAILAKKMAKMLFKINGEKNVMSMFAQKSKIQTNKIQNKSKQIKEKWQQKE